MTAYRRLHEQGCLSERVEAARILLSQCRLYPHECGIDRLHGEKGFCHTSRYAAVAHYGPHYGEE